MSEQYNFTDGRKGNTFFNHLVLGCGIERTDELTKDKDFDSSAMMVDLKINGVDIRVCDFNEVMDKWEKRLVAATTEELNLMSKDNGVAENANILLKSKLGRLYDLIEVIGDEDLTGEDTVDEMKFKMYDLKEHLRVVRDLVSEGAKTGFIPLEGEWADKLFKSNAKTSKLLGE